MCRNGKIPETDFIFLTMTSQGAVLLCYFTFTLIEIKHHNVNVESEESFVKRNQTAFHNIELQNVKEKNAGHMHISFLELPF